MLSLPLLCASYSIWLSLSLLELVLRSLCLPHTVPTMIVEQCAICSRVSLGPMRRKEDVKTDLYNRSSVSESRPEKDVSITEQSILQGDDDELRRRESSTEQSTNVLSYLKDTLANEITKSRRLIYCAINQERHQSRLEYTSVPYCWREN